MADKTEHRILLPAPMQNCSDLKLLSVLKNCIGKDLSKITMPVVFNEPLSFLQRISEYMEYAFLLRLAAEKPDPATRMQYVAGFAVSALASNWGRMGKPFNPLLGETYELEREDFRIVCEQVSHHPPVSAFHADSKDWVFHGSIHPKLKLWGMKHVEIEPVGTLTLEFPKFNEVYTWKNVKCCVHNLIVGKMWIEQCGLMEICNHATEHRAMLKFKSTECSSTKDLHHVEGAILDQKKWQLFYIYGKWTNFIKCIEHDKHDEYIKLKQPTNKHERSKSPKDSPSNTPSRVLQKLNSLKVSPFRSNSTQESVDEATPPDVPEGQIPKSDSTDSMDIPNAWTIWKAKPRPQQTNEYYHFTEFAMSLNEIDKNMGKLLCPTDSRLRPDIRKLENGDIDGAAVEKTRLEEKQREANKQRKSKKGVEWRPKWFQKGKNPYTDKEDWIFTGQYWDRNYADNPDIF